MAKNKPFSIFFHVFFAAFLVFGPPGKSPAANISSARIWGYLFIFRSASPFLFLSLAKLPKNDIIETA